MRLLWTLVKVVLALALVIPVSVILLATILGIFGAVLGLAVLALKLAVVGLLAWGVFRVTVAIFGGRKRPEPVRVREQLPPPDPHFEAAMRELDRELGHQSP